MMLAAVNVSRHDPWWHGVVDRTIAILVHHGPQVVAGRTKLAFGMLWRQTSRDNAQSCVPSPGFYTVSVWRHFFTGRWVS